jgi:hypothetical protein
MDALGRNAKVVRGPSRCGSNAARGRAGIFLRGRFGIDVIYLSTAVGFTPGGNNTIHIYTQTIHRTRQITTEQLKQYLISKSEGRAPY